MLSFPIRSLSQGAIEVDADLAPDDAVWSESDVRPISAIRVTGRLNGAGNDRFYFSGVFEGKSAGECRRCLVPVEFKVAGETHLIFADADDETSLADEPDVFPLGELGSTVDLRPAIREQWLLDASDLPLCREDCKGLCPTCGADRNIGPCSCQMATPAR